MDKYKEQDKGAEIFELDEDEEEKGAYQVEPEKEKDIIYKTQHGSANLLPMKTFISRPRKLGVKREQLKVDALVDLGCSVLILSYDLSVKLELEAEMLGNASGIAMDISGKAVLKVRQQQGIRTEIRIIISKSLGKEEMVVGLADLKSLNLLHKDFPRPCQASGGRASCAKISEWRRTRSRRRPGGCYCTSRRRTSKSTTR